MAPDPVSLLLSVFATFAEKITELLVKMRGEKVRRNNEAAVYFEDLSAAMTKVVEGLRANEIPRISGHAMQTLIYAFREKTKHLLNGHESAALKASLDDAANIAQTLDAWLLMDQTLVQGDREQMLAQIERIAADCRGLAGVLKTPA